MSASSVSTRELTRSVLLFVLTTLSVWAVYVFDRTTGLALPAQDLAREGAIFAGSLMTVLLCHEMGHFLVARAHGLSTSPPAFIPLPLPGSFGTMGAVIRIRALPDSREALLEMGAAGPIAGAVVAFALLWYGVPLTRPPDALQVGTAYGIYNDPLVVKVIGILTTGAPPDRYGSYHPAAMAGWVGCLLTGINLLPVGQLDGGHVFNAIAPRLAPRVSRFFLLTAIASVVFYAAEVAWTLLAPPEATGGFSPTPATFAVFILILHFLGGARPLEIPDDPPVPLRARVVALVALVLFVLTFMPMPIEIEVYQGG